MVEERLRKLMLRGRAHDLDCVALVPGANLRYLTGLKMFLSERPIVAFFPIEGRPALLLPAFEATRLKDDLALEIDLYPYRDEEGHEGALERACSTLGLAGKRTGVEYLTMRVLELKLLEEHAPGCQIVALESLMTELRLVKDATEIEHMRRAVDITEQALRGVREIIRPGLTELQVAAELKMALFRTGAEGLAFDPLVLAGPNSASPHASPSERPIQSGDVVTIDCGATWRGYCADITRVFAVGRIDPELEKAYRAVKEANRAGRAAARMGVPAQEVDRAARRVIIEAGYGEYFSHRTGHGLGLEVHEPPYIVEGNERVLEPGMVFTVEPGIYLTGVGGVRIEDDVMVTANGAETLTAFSRELIRL